MHVQEGRGNENPDPSPLNQAEILSRVRQSLILSNQTCVERQLELLVDVLHFVHLGSISQRYL